MSLLARSMLSGDHHLSTPALQWVMLFLTESDVRELLPIGKAVELMEAMFHRLAAGESLNQPRRRLILPTGSTLHYMAGADGPYFGTKVYSDPSQAWRKLPFSSLFGRRRQTAGDDGGELSGPDSHGSRERVCDQTAGAARSQHSRHHRQRLSGVYSARGHASCAADPGRLRSGAGLRRNGWRSRGNATLSRSIQRRKPCAAPISSSRRPTQRSLYSTPAGSRPGLMLTRWDRTGLNAGSCQPELICARD